MSRTFRVTAVAVCVSATAASLSHAQLTFEFTKSPGFLALEVSDPTKATAMYDAAVGAGSKYSSLFSDPVTLKFTLDYGTTPSGVLAFADSAFAPAPYTSVKSAMIADATSINDFTSLGSLPAGPFVPLYRNDTADLTFPEKEPFLDPTPGSVNNMMLDMGKSNLKALGLLGGTAGGAGADGTIKVSDATTFDFDHTNGIDTGAFDFHGVMLHEIAHAMGFISGTDTMAIHLSSPPAVVDGLPMITTLDLFRYSPLSITFGARDISLPLPGVTGDASLRFFSLDGGATILDYFSTGDGPFGFGDGEQGGHWKTDGTFGLMDPSLASGFNLTAAWDTLLAGPTPADLIALDTIGWNYIPSPGTGAIVSLLATNLTTRRRRV